ncbi:uncharacterized protein LOC108817353 isoform X2 [Raphanus sativus]|uniref:Uncharacterized protein LOC108817353 isoform X2 n=1 Tax=Raphanus sativus TaxID=3726 RepID=A0A9W3C4V0_RAPSA|nr:uncharacterized protein LOC108817353 isoform X2 [Raphanus sativus]
MVEKEDKKVTRVLFCGPHFPDSYNFTRDYLQPYPFIQADVAHLRDVPQVIKNYDICVTMLMQMDSYVISRASNMKLLMQFGVGLDGVDIDAATKHGIKVARIPSEGNGNAVSCSEMAIYLMLGLLKKQNEMKMSVQSRFLGQPTGGTLLGKTVFILGYGNIGIELAKRLKPFGSRVIATKRSWPVDSDSSLVDEKGSHEDIYTFASKADIVVVCLRLSKETAEIVDKKFISSMKKGALLVNIARGGLVNYESAYQSLESGHLGGLGTDVAWSEPFDPNDPILKFKNVIMTLMSLELLSIHIGPWPRWSEMLPYNFMKDFLSPESNLLTDKIVLTRTKPCLRHTFCIVFYFTRVTEKLFVTSLY